MLLGASEAAASDLSDFLRPDLSDSVGVFGYDSLIRPLLPDLVGLSSYG